jgi:hypothetical protein
MSASRSIEDRLRSVVLELADSLPEDDIDSILGLIEAREWGVALENLCTQLDEYDVTVPSPLLAEIASLGRKMKLDPGLWESLRSSTSRPDGSDSH